MGTNEARYRAAEARMWQSVGLTPTEQFLELRRTGVTVRAQEVGNGPPVVMVHGASNTGTSWAQLIAGLGDYRCIALDRPGCGLSPPHPTGFADIGRFEAFADDLIADVLDALGLDRGHVVATSFGGYMALRGAAAHPDRFDRMVLMGWSFGSPMVLVPFVMRVAAIPAIGRMMASMPANERAVRMIFKQVGLRQALEAGRVSPEMIGTFLALLRDTRTMRNELDAGPRLIRPIKGFNDEVLLSDDVLGRIRTPTYFLWGEEDPMGGPDIARAFAGRVPGAELELMPGAGHAVWIDDPDHAAKTVDAFLRR